MEKIENGKYQANYQLVVISHLIQTPKLRDNKTAISKVLQQKNKAFKKDVGHFKNCPVWRVLTNHGIISKIGDDYKLNLTQKPTNTQRKEIENQKLRAEKNELVIKNNENKKLMDEIKQEREARLASEIEMKQAFAQLRDEKLGNYKT